MIDLNDLFIFEMANNHQGDPDHGLAIIRAMGKVARANGINAAVKLQYRNLDTFVHPDEINNKENKHVSRFLSTRLENDQFRTLVQAIRKEGMTTVCTPFDEDSVDLILEHGIDVIKIASACADDWPLVQKIVSAGRPVIASTGGLLIHEIDNLYSYLTHRLQQVAILHCLSVYPAPDGKLNMSVIRTMAERYPDVTIGYSGHEEPGNYDVIKIAVSLGARVFERHVGLPTDRIKLNAYSLDPEQADRWVKAALAAKTVLGTSDKNPDPEERNSLFLLKRGVFAEHPIKKGEMIRPEDVFYAFPIKEGQLTSGEFGRVRARYSASKNYKANEAIFENWDLDTYHKIRQIIHKAKGLLEENRIVIGSSYEIELSHHYGIEKFDKYGSILIKIVNREYCKKIILVFAGQHHPEQRHMKKEETFHILQGELVIFVNGIERAMKKGDIQVIERGVTHSFYTNTGTIIEEISTSHIIDDSYYSDPLIAEQDPMQRKTRVERF
jgi:N-acetylneuraminate synthase